MSSDDSANDGTSTGSRERYETVFDRPSSVVAIVEGPQHRFVFVNDMCQRLIGHRHVLGHSVADSLQDAVAQGYVTLLDEVYATGLAKILKQVPYIVQPAADGPILHRLMIDLMIQPVCDAYGKPSGILIEGTVHELPNECAQAQAQRM